MPQQRTKPDQKQTYRTNKQNRIENRHVLTTNKIGSETDMSQQQIKPDQNRHAATTNKTESTTHIPQQHTYRNNKQNRTKTRHVATMNKTESTANMPEQQTKPDQKQTRCNKLAAD
jgi:hypothetical protein